MFRFWDIIFFIFKADPSTSKIVTSSWALAHKEEYLFEYIFWISNHLNIKLGQLIDIIMNNILGNIWNDLEN